MSGRSFANSDASIAATSAHAATAAPVHSSSAASADVADLRRAVQLRDRMLDLTSKGCIVIDARKEQSSVLFVNRAFARFTRYSPSELVGSPVTVVVENDLAAKTHTVQIGDRASVNGVLLEMVRDSQDRVTHYIGVVADAAVQMAAERARDELQVRLDAEMRERQRVELELHLSQKLEAVGRLAAGVAHEINTPIQYVGDSIHFLRSAAGDLERTLNEYRNGLAQIIAGASASDVQSALTAVELTNDIEFHAAEMPKAFARTLEGVERVAQIVRAMKEFSHPDVDEQSPADINHALQSTLIVAKNEYKYAAKIETDFTELPLVVCNIGELNQVFLNLLVNAAHAIADTGKDADTGAIAITTRLMGDAIEITLADNGCGIPQENLDKIFDPFFTTKEVGKGTGQGLAITRAIVVEKHAGSVHVDSRIGVGTKFTLRLPIAGRPSVEALA